MDFETKKALELLDAELDKRYGMALSQIEHSGVDWQARERGVGAASGYGYAIDELRAILRDHSPTGYDVYCSQDAPTFASWERVAWVKNAAPFYDIIPLYDSQNFPSSALWDIYEEDGDVFCVREYAGDYDSDYGIVRRYRILPAGSPAPEDGAL